jgi:hypothetical protein
MAGSTGRNQIVQYFITDTLIRQMMDLLSVVVAANVPTLAAIARKNALTQISPRIAFKVTIIPIPPFSPLFFPSLVNPVPVGSFFILQALR